MVELHLLTAIGLTALSIIGSAALAEWIHNTH